MPEPPPTRREEIVETLHGVEIADPYRWLEESQSVETRAWLEAQNAFTRNDLDAWPGRESLWRRLSELMTVDSVTEPVVRDGTYLFLRQRREQQLAAICRRVGPRGVDEILIDPADLSRDGSITVTLLDVAPDASILVYGVRQGGEDEMAIRLFDMAARRDLPDCLPRGNYFGVELRHDLTGFYYSTMTPDGPRIRCRMLGSPSDADEEIFGVGYDPGKIIFTSLSDDGRFLLITVLYGSAARQTELHLLDISAGGPVRPVIAGVEARFLGTVAGGRLYLETNWDAPNGRILRADLSDLRQESWQEIVAESGDPIQNVFAAGGRLFVHYIHNVSSQIACFDPDGARLPDVPLPDTGTVTWLSGRWREEEIVFGFTSFDTPLTIFRYSVSHGICEEWAHTETSADIERLRVRQVWFESRDGTRVPMFLVHDRDLARDGNRPTLLTGYGGFLNSLTPSFSAATVLWVESGGVYAVANLRGGGEFGEAWHQAGMLEKKQNVFDDFIAAAEFLIRENYTRPERLAIAGGSNGGLLVGAVMSQRPKLMRAVVCSYPLLDMLRYQRFLKARFWVPEYGSSDDPDDFAVLHAYSPYHNVRLNEEYPAVLFVTGDADTRVDPLHARKMTALLQWSTRSDRPVLLLCDMEAGHIRTRPRAKEIDDLVDRYSFLFRELGVARST